MSSSLWLLLISAVPIVLSSLYTPLESRYDPSELRLADVQLHERSKARVLADLPGTKNERMRRIPHVITPLHYYVRIRPYFPYNEYSIPEPDRNMTFDGIQTLIFKVVNNTDVITLHSFNLEYQHIKLMDKDGITIEDNMTHEENKTLHHVIVRPKKRLTVDEIYMIQYTYTGHINDYKSAGLYYTHFEDKEGNWHWIVVTHMEPARARAVFPCLDEPAYKAIFHITLIYPSGLIALANTMERTPVPLGKETPDSAWSVIQFPPSLKMSTYLVAFAVGPFVKQEKVDPTGILVRIWGWTGQEKYLEFAANTSVKCLYKMGLYTNFRYPMPKSDQLGLPEFVAGAMENYGLIIYKYQFIAFDPEIQSTYYKQAAARVMCHELAHQWFGDTVTALWWDDLFLQEGFAAFFENYGLRMALPEQIPFLEGKFLVESQQGGLEADAVVKTSHPIYDVNGPFFDAITYLKGSSVLRMIRAVIGPENFQKALQEYIKMYKFSNANHQMLFERFTAASKHNRRDWCDRPLDATLFLNPWFLQQSFPEVMVTNNQPTAPAVLTQEPFNAWDTLPHKQSIYNFSWPVPIFYRDYKDNYKSQLAKFKWLPPVGYSPCPASFAVSRKPTKVQMESAHWDMDNANASSFVRVEYDDIGYDRLMQRIRIKPDEFSLGDKIILLADRLAFLQRKMQRNEPFSYDRLMDVITTVLPGDTQFGMFEEAQKVIDPLELMFLDGPDYGLFKKFIAKVLTKNYDKLKWQDTGFWDDDATRYLLLPYAVRYDLSDSVDEGRKLFEEMLQECATATTGVDKCNKINPDVRIPAYCAGIKRGTSADFDRLMELLEQQYKNQFYFYQEYYAMLEGMACTTVQSDMDKLIHRALTLVRFPQDKYKLARLPYDIIIKNPMTGQWMAEYLLKNSAEIVNSVNFEEYLRSMTSVWHTEARLAQMKSIRDELIKKQPSVNKDLLDKYVEVTQQHVDWRNKYYPDLSRVFYNEYVVGPFDMENWNHKLPLSLKPISYDLEIKPHIPGSAKYEWYRNMTFEGHVKMNFTATNEAVSGKITINAHRMVLEASKITLKKADGTMVRPYTPKTIEKDFDLAFLTIPLPSDMKIEKDEVWTLEINYTGFIFGHPSKGVYTNTNFYEFNGKMAWIFSTYFESGPSARSLAPCFDQPNYKATWKITVHHPADMIALSNMPEEGFTIQPNGWATSYFPTTPIMSSYLIAVAAGHFASLQTVSKTGVLVRTWAWTGMERYAETALRTAAGQVDFMSTYFKFPYMLPKLDVLALPQYTTMHGAEEHWGFIHILYRYMLADKAYATADDYAYIASITSHETVHQWFGNLVTIEFWPYIFLQEASANYWETNGSNRTFPEQHANAKLERFLKAYSGFITDSSTRTSKPVVPDKPLYFTGIPYNKGATLLYMMSQALGAPVFQEGLQTYLQAYQYKNVIPSNMFTHLTEAARKNNVMGWDNKPLDMAELMGAWIYQATYPVLKETVDNDNNVVYSQEPFIKDTSALQTSTYGWVWNIPVHSQMQGKPGRVLNYFVGKDGGSNALWKRTFDGNWQVDNAALGGFFRVWYDEKLWQPIQQQLESDPFEFDVLTRAQLISDTVALQQRGSLKWDRVLKIGLYLAKETEYAPFLAFRQTIRDFITMFSATSSNAVDKDNWDLVKRYLQKVIGPIYDKVGWKNSSDWTQRMLASFATEYACKLSYSDCRQKASTSFIDFKTNCEMSRSGTGLCNSMVPDLRRTQYCWGVHENPESIDVVEKLYRWFVDNSRYFHRDTENLLEAQACTTDATQLKDLIHKTVMGELPTGMLTYLGNRDEKKRVMWDYFKTNWTLVSFGVPPFQDYMEAAMTFWNTQEDLNLADGFLNGAEGDMLSDDQKTQMRNAMKKVEARIKWRNDNQQEIIQWLRDNVPRLYE